MAIAVAMLAAAELSVSAPVAAVQTAEKSQAAECSGVAADRAAALALAATCGIQVESLADRTEWDSLFAEVDGVSFTWESSAKAIRAQAGDAWTSISTSLVSRAGGLSPEASALPMMFSDGGDAVLARIGRDGHELVMDSPLPGRLPVPVVSGSSLTYAAVLPGVDLIVSVNEDGTGFSQVLRVASRLAAAHPALAELVFPVQTTDGLRIAQRAGGFVAVDDAGQEVFTSPAPRMWDSAGVIAERVDAAVDVQASSELRVVRPLDGDTVAVMPLTASQDAVTVRPVGGLLADSRTVWPVFIDPSVSGSRNEWVMIQSGFGGDDNNWKFSGDEGTGRCQVSVTSACVQDNTKRIVWEFGFPAAARGKHITSATFKAYQANAYDCDTGWVRVYKTAAIGSGTVWDNFHSQMDGTNSLRSVDETRRPGCALGPGWTSWSVTSGVQASADAQATWIALGVRSTNETSMPSSWKRFRYDATLSITYNTKPGTATLLAPSAGVITTDSTPTLQAKASDADGNTVRLSFEVATSGGSLVRSSTSGFVASGATVSYTPSALGQGNYKFRVRAYDGVDYGPWSGYRNFSVDLTGPTFSNVKTNGSGCGQATTDTTPTLSVVLTDNYGGNVEADFELRNKTTGVLVVDTGTSLAALPSGSTFTHTTPALASGSYEWRVRGQDARGLWGGYTGWCGYEVDLVPPDAPAVDLQADPYQVGVAGQFTATGDPDTVSYLWGVNTDTPTTVVATTAGAAKTITMSASLSSKFGPNWVSVRSEDQFGNPSGITRLVFDVEGFGDSGRWRLDGNGQDVDCSGESCLTRAGGHPLAFTGTHDWVDGKYAYLDTEFGPEEFDLTDRAVQLDGSTGSGATAGSVVATTANFSVSAWVRLAPSASYPAAVSQIGGQAAAFYLGYAEGAWAFTMKSIDGVGGAMRAKSAPVTPDPDQWVHLIGVYDHANKKIRLYVDGEPAGEATFAATWQAGGPLMVGGSQYQAVPADFWPGVIDEVRVFPGALTEADVAVVFGETRLDPAPSVLATTPEPDAVDVPLDTVISVTFSEPVDPATIDLQVAGPAGAPVAGTIGYDPGSDTATFTPDQPLESLTEHTLTVTAADPGGILMPAPVTIWFTTEQGDTTPPTVSGLTPAPGAVDVPLDATISAVFSEPVDEASILVDVRDTADSIVPGAVTYDPGTGEVGFAPDDDLDPWRTYTVTISGAVDSAGNLMVAESWSFTAQAGPPACPCSLWAETTTPATASVPETDPVEVGVKFQPAEDGYITGIRFYKGAGNTGTHLGHLWAADGTQLAEATFTGETATGWQQVYFPAAVPVQAGTIYVASYYAPAGGHAADTSYFTTPLFSGPLTALGDGEEPNGVHLAAPGGGFPTTPGGGTNYWVDIVFTGTGLDTTPPAIIDRSPAPDSTNVPVDTVVAARFNEAILDATTVVEVRDPAEQLVPGNASYDPTTATVTFTPTNDLAGSTTYTINISGTQDVAGNPMTPDTWSFTTVTVLATCPCSIWSEASVSPTYNPDLSGTRGVKFRSDQNGLVSGIRFYHCATCSFPSTFPTVYLWSADGSLLASKTAGKVPGQGWFFVLFDSPAPISADTTYVAGYSIVPSFSGGGYAEPGYFAASGVTNGPLTALQAGVDGPNGVHGAGFPDIGTDVNYWVDVIFETE